MTETMPLSVTVLSLEDALSTELSAFDAIISIQDPNQKTVLSKMPSSTHHLVQQFHDLEKYTPYIRGPLASDIIEVLKFYEFYKPKRLLIHCNEGISRSPAMSLAIFLSIYGRGHEDEAVNSVVASASPWIDPNRLIVEYVDHHFECQGKLITLVRNTYDGLR